jgi:LysR family transcriptional regulator, regulator for bpeEF and oprC
MDKLRSIEAFVRVVELGSFTRAADALHVPKATVTKLVAELEARLGIKLLHRTTRRLSLSDDGAAYLEGAQRLLADLSELEGQVTRSVKSPRGRLRVDVPAAAGRHVLAPALPAFFAKHPDIQIELGSSDRPVDLLAEGVDVVIRGGLTHDDTLVARPLGTFEVITCAAPSYLKRHGRPRSPQALHDKGHVAVNFFSAKTGRVFDFEFRRGDETLAITLPHRVAANDADTHIAAAVAGLGLIQSPRTRYVHSLIDDRQLVPVLDDWSAGALPLVLMYPRHRHLSARLRVFVDWAVALYAKAFAALPPRRMQGGA